MDNDEKIMNCANVVKAFGHPLRLKILLELADREIDVNRLVEVVGTSQSNISQHLALLRQAKLVSTIKSANQVIYRIRNKEIFDICLKMMQLFGD